ncbi:MAG: hypothetical protein R3F61_08610 [Myxococcota bacterium]
MPRNTTGRPVGKVACGERGPIAEIFVYQGVPPTDLRVRWVTDVPGRDALNTLFLGIHPMELQHVLPPIAAGEDVLLTPQPAGHPLLPDGREAAVLETRRPDGRWSLTRSSGADGVTATGERVHLVWLARLYASVVLGSLADPAPDLPWIRPVRAARDAFEQEAPGPFVPQRAR